jgi:hypothetical protein
LIGFFSFSFSFAAAVYRTTEANKAGSTTLLSSLYFLDVYGGTAHFKNCKQWQTTAFEISKKEKRYKKAPPPSYLKDHRRNSYKI